LFTSTPTAPAASSTAATAARIDSSLVTSSASVRQPRLRYTAGGLATRLRMLRTFAPAGVMDAAMRKDLRLA